MNTVRVTKGHFAMLGWFVRVEVGAVYFGVRKRVVSGLAIAGSDFLLIGDSNLN